LHHDEDYYYNIAMEAYNQAHLMLNSTTVRTDNAYGLMMYANGDIQLDISNSTLESSVGNSNQGIYLMASGNMNINIEESRISHNNTIRTESNNELNYRVVDSHFDHSNGLTNTTSGTANIYIENSTFENETELATPSYGIQSHTTGATTFQMVNSTIANYVQDGINLTSDESVHGEIIDSTIVGNVENGFNIDSPDTIVSLYNNLLFANTTDINLGATGTGTLHGAYNVYGTTTQNFTNSIYNTQSNMTNVQMFGTNTPNTNEQGTVVITTTSHAAYKGTLIGKVGNVTYFLNRYTNHWENFTNNTTYAFDETSDTFGLPENGTIFHTAQNVDTDNNPVSRIQTMMAFNAGAYALTSDKLEDASTIVTTATDIFNPWDNKISLREAVQYTTYQGQGTNVTFDNSLFTNNQATIQLDSFYGEIQNTSETLSIHGGENRNVTIDAHRPANVNYRIFSAYDTTKNWDIQFNNLTFTGGNAGEIDQNNINDKNGLGGAIFLYGNTSTLALENVIVDSNTAYVAGGGIYTRGTNSNITIDKTQFTNNTSPNGGAIYSNASNISSIVVQNSLLSNNSSTSNGGAIYGNSTNTSKILVQSSTFTNNTATGSGGAIYNKGLTNSTISLENTTIFSNTAKLNGGGIYQYSNGNNTIHVVDSTIAGNKVLDNHGAGICQDNGTQTLTLLNAIVYGNYKEISGLQEAKDIDFINAVGNAPTFNVAYSIYGASSHNISNNSIEAYQYQLNQLGEVFVLNNNQLELTDSNTLAIINTEQVAYKGTLIGKIGTDYYFYHQTNNQWQSFSIDTTYNFNTIAPTYGLTNGTVITVAQNLDNNNAPVSRVQTLFAFNIGAHALNKTQGLNLHVTSLLDINNPFDDKLTLREALQNAGIGVLSDQVNYINTATVTFDNTLFANDQATIIINSTLILPTIPAYGNQNSISFTIEGGENRNVTIQRNATSPAFNILATNNTTSNYDITLNNLTITGGQTTTNGGALHIDGVQINLTTNNTIFSNNQANNGGAVYIHATTLENSNATFNIATFQNNIATTNGGAIYSNIAVTITGTETNISNISQNQANKGGAIYSESTLTINNANFDTNTATENGGAIYASGETNIDNNTFENNEADNGGAIYSTSTLTVNDTTFNTNIATTNGGAIYTTNETNINTNTFASNEAINGGAIYSTSTLTVNDTTFSTNIATTNGGAIYTTNETNINKNTFDNNEANNGGAIYATSTLIVNNETTFTTNIATNNGGAIYTSGETNIDSNIFTNNEAIDGGAIYSDSTSTLTVDNTEFDTNIATNNGGAI
jgi:predicted outer membrane repeat protein